MAPVAGIPQPAVDVCILSLRMGSKKSCRRLSIEVNKGPCPVLKRNLGTGRLFSAVAILSLGAMLDEMRAVIVRVDISLLGAMLDEDSNSAAGGLSLEPCYSELCSTRAPCSQCDWRMLFPSEVTTV